MECVDEQIFDEPARIKLLFFLIIILYFFPASALLSGYYLLQVLALLEEIYVEITLGFKSPGEELEKS